MIRGRPTRSRRWGGSARAGLVVVALVAVACADDGDAADTSDDAVPIATVRGQEITESDVQVLVDDPGFVSFLRTPEPDDDAVLSETEAGRRALTWLVYQALVDAELDTHDLTLDDEALEAMAADLQAGEVPDEVDGIVHGDTEMGEVATATVAEGLTAYAALDQWLRTVDPANAELRERVLAGHPEIRHRVCGSAVAVDEADADAVRDHLVGGGTLDQLADELTLVRTAAGGVCLTRGSFRRQLVDVLYGTPVGSAGETRVVDRSTGQPVVFFVVPSVRDEVPDDELGEALSATLQRLHDEGGAAFAELIFSTVDPELDPAWGTWDPIRGVVATDATPSFSTFELPEPTPTTTTTAVPTPAPADDFVDDAEPILAGGGSGDPGTADLVARVEAALDSTLPTAWRQAVPVQVSIISGPTSWSYHDGRIEVGTVHATGDWFKLQAVIDHEIGHHVAFRYGSQAENGAAPTGWPVSGVSPVERWADCVSETYTGYGLSDGSGPCTGDSLSFTVDWMAQGPDAHPRTG